MAHCGSTKTTIDISDNLLNRAKRLARKERTTLKSLTEEGLSLVLERHAAPSQWNAEPVLFDGNGVSGEFRGKPWAEIRDEIYKGYGT